MFSAALTEWLPTSGVSWQNVQLPTIESGTVTPLANVWPLNPPTPAMVIGFVLKTTSPRAMALRASVNESFRALAIVSHGVNSVNAWGERSAVRVQTHRVVYPGEERLVRQVDRPAFGHL